MPWSGFGGVEGRGWGRGSGKNELGLEVDGGDQRRRRLEVLRVGLEAANRDAGSFGYGDASFSFQSASFLFCFSALSSFRCRFERPRVCSGEEVLRTGEDLLGEIKHGLGSWWFAD
jgi:hypothetical protein